MCTRRQDFPSSLIWTKSNGWKKGGVVSLDSLPSVEDSDIYNELMALAHGLDEKGNTLYAVDTRHSELGVTANYNFVPGFDFRERTPNRSIGLFVGPYPG